ncbi:MAG: hypothetical protein RR381_05490 [Raoultibacter sp.]
MRYKSIMISFLVVLSVLSLSLLACAPQQTTSADNNKAESSSASFEWSKDSDCGTCHGTETASFDSSACLASVHSGAKANCLSCHTDASGLKSAHSNVKADSHAKIDKLKKTKIASEACASCHDKTKLSDLTASCTILTDDKGTVVNPHKLTPSESHDAITCANCHKMHSDKPIADTAAKACTDCHHANVYECGTCHS